MLPFSNLVFCLSNMLRSFWFICLALFLLFTSNLLWFQPNCKFVSALGNETDQMAMLKFKESISNDPFEVLTSWNSSIQFCNWHRVTCNSWHQRVTQLNLTGYRLHGFISPHLGNLSFLRILNLENNNFFGKVPPELGRLFRLQILYFSNNTLGGDFPITLTNCSELRGLSLQENHLTGQIPKEIDTIGKLEMLQISMNNLTGQILASIGNLSSLNFLSLAINKLEGNIPKEIGHLKNLETLYVGGNNLSGTLPSSLYNLSSLIKFSTAFNQFNGSLPANMFLTLPNLKYVGFALNQFSGPIPTSIKNASGIQTFEISSNQFLGQVPSLGKLRDLSYLSLSHNNLGSNSFKDLEFLKSLVNCSQLNIFDISYNDFGGPLPNSMGNFSTQLTKLFLGGNQIYGKIPIEIGNLEDLILLTIEDNHLTDIIPTTFAKFRKMQLLSLFGNKLSGEIPACIGNLSQLFKLELSHNMLVGDIPSTIGNCKGLQSLDLSDNNLSGPIPSQVIGLSSLSNQLNLSYNSLSGSLPAEVGMLKNIDVLDLSENYLSGGIPATIGECITLEYLYLQGNYFHGIIPPSLASLKGLRKLDLSRNNLSGSIPKAIQNISVLEYFNMSFNMLEGEVPTGGIFQNASAISMISNGKLCGGLSKLKLPPCPLKAMKKKKHHNLWLIVVIISSIASLLLLSCILIIYQIRKKHRKAFVDSTIDQLPKVSYRCLYHATDGFLVRNLIGTGSLGSVYKGRLNSQERVVAIKVLNLQKKGAHNSFIAECNALRNIRHRNLVKILTCCSSVDYNGNEFKALVFEYMPNGSLDEWLHPEKGTVEQPRTLNLERRLEIVIGVASALHYLHYECEQPVVHCDLKPSNVLLDDDMVAHVSDFGIARLLLTNNDNSHKQTSTSGMKGTIGYAPPEYGMGSQVSTEGDMYSYGILILEMLTGRRPTAEMFKDGYNLHKYVKIAFPNDILEIVDATLLPMENEYPTVKVEEEKNLYEIAPFLHPNVEKCLLSLFRIGLACTVESPKERMNIMEVTRELNTIINTFSS